MFTKTQINIKIKKQIKSMQITAYVIMSQNEKFWLNKKVLKTLAKAIGSLPPGEM